VDRGQHPLGHRRSRHPQLRVHAGHHQVELGQQLVLLVQRAVLEDVDLDPGEDPERRQLLVEQRDLDQLGPQPVRGQPVGDREPGRVVGEHEVRVAEVAGGDRHLPDRRPAVRPGRVGVAVTAQRVPQRHPGRGRRVQPGSLAGPLVDRLAGAGLQVDQVVGHLAGQRLRHHRRRLLADAGQLAQRAQLDPAPQRVHRDLPEHVRGPPERPHPVRRLVPALHQEGDAAQVVHGVAGAGHPTIVAG
jgi:hypothetical protein